MASHYQQDDQESKIAMLVSMGFETTAVTRALDLCGGHLEQAANHLLMGGGISDDNNTAAAAAASESSHSTVNSGTSGGSGGGGGGGGGGRGDHNDDVRIVIAPISQYSVDNGRSACTCIALTAAQDFLKQQQQQQQQQQSFLITSEFLQNVILHGVEIYNNMLRHGDSNVQHKSVEEILVTTTTFSFLYMPDMIQQGMLTSSRSNSTLSSSNDNHPQSLQGLLAASQHATEWTCVLITKTPETVLVCLPPLSSSNSTTVTSSSEDSSSEDNSSSSYYHSYILIDSHPRPQQFPGATQAYARFHSSLHSLVTSSLDILFPYMDLGPDVPELMAAMYNQFDLYRFRLSNSQQSATTITTS